MKISFILYFSCSKSQRSRLVHFQLVVTTISSIYFARMDGRTKNFRCVSICSTSSVVKMSLCSEKRARVISALHREQLLLSTTLHAILSTAVSRVLQPLLNPYRMSQIYLSTCFRHLFRTVVNCSLVPITRYLRNTPLCDIF